MRLLNLLFSSIFLAVLLSCTHAVCAQVPTNWPVSPPTAKSTHADVVLLAEPGIRHHCHVHEITPTQIVCGIGMGRKPIAYPADAVAAIIETHKDPTRKTVAIVLLGGAAYLAGSFFVPVVGVAVFMRVIAGISLVVAWVAELGDNPEPYRDVLLYQRPGTPLTVALH